jgi:hypothetical protein
VAALLLPRYASPVAIMEAMDSLNARYG